MGGDSNAGDQFQNPHEVASSLGKMMSPSTTVALLRICNPGSYLQPIMMAFVTQGLLSEPSMIRAEFTLLLSPPSFRIGFILFAH